MKKVNGFANLSLILLAALIAGACSPLAPSVSKLSNAGGQKATPNDGSTPTANGTGPGIIIQTKPATQLEQQVTQTIPLSQFRNDWDLIEDVKPVMELYTETVTEVLKNEGTASFSSSSERVKGREDMLASSKTKIMLVVDTDLATIKNRGLDDIKATLKWQPSTAHWELALVPPTRDGVIDPFEADRLKKELGNHLVEIGIEFEVN